MTVPTTTYPDSAVVYITDSIGGLKYQARGVLIAPGYNLADVPFGTSARTSIHSTPINDFNDQITLQQSRSDFAVIHLASAVRCEFQVRLIRAQVAMPAITRYAFGSETQLAQEAGV